MHPDRERWNGRYADPAFRGPAHPSRFLEAHAALLTGGVALDVACGRGDTAAFLARRGYRVLGVDISDVGLTACRRATRDLPGGVHLLLADLDRIAFPPGRFDLVTILFYHQPALAPLLTASLRPGGLLLAQTFNERRAAMSPPFNPRYLPRVGELAGLFRGLTVIAAADGMADHPELSFVVARKVPC